MKGKAHVGESFGSPWRTLKAFTLIELLVVVAIIALLVAILVPALQKAKPQTRQVVCLANLHSIGTAAMVYTNAYDGLIPRGNDVRWYMAFLPFLQQANAVNDYRQVKIYRCPDYPEQSQSICYVDNAWEFSSEEDTVGYEIGEPTRLARIARASKTVYLADNESGWWRPIVRSPNDPETYRHDVWHPTHLPSSEAENLTYGRRVARDRHNGGPNVLYFDGHAGWIQASAMTHLTWRGKWNWD